MNIVVNLLIIKNVCIQSSKTPFQILLGIKKSCWTFFLEDGWRIF